jgi:hypothetical protein
MRVFIKAEPTKPTKQQPKKRDRYGKLSYVLVEVPPKDKKG